MKPKKPSPWFGVARDDLAALRRRFVGVKYSTRLAVYLATVELANYLNRPSFTMTRDQIGAATGCTPRAITPILRDLVAAKLIDLADHKRKQDGTYAPFKITLAGATKPRFRYTAPEETTSPRPEEVDVSDLLPHSREDAKASSRKEKVLRARPPKGGAAQAPRPRINPASIHPAVKLWGSECER